PPAPVATIPTNSLRLSSISASRFRIHDRPILETSNPVTQLDDWYEVMQMLQTAAFARVPLGIKGNQGDGIKGTDGTFSDIYLNYLVGQVLIGGSRKRGTSRLSLAPHRCRDLQNQEKSWNEK